MSSKIEQIVLMGMRTKLSLTRKFIGSLRKDIRDVLDQRTNCIIVIREKYKDVLKFLLPLFSLTDMIRNKEEVIMFFKKNNLYTLYKTKLICWVIKVSLTISFKGLMLIDTIEGFFSHRQKST